MHQSENFIKAYTLRLSDNFAEGYNMPPSENFTKVTHCVYLIILLTCVICVS